MEHDSAGVILYIQMRDVYFIVTISAFVGQADLKSVDNIATPVDVFCTFFVQFPIYTMNNKQQAIEHAAYPQCFPHGSISV